MLKKSTLFSLVAASAWLSPAPSVAVAQETDAAKQVLAQLNAERETTRILLEQLQSTDPTVIDVYFKLGQLPRPKGTELVKASWVDQG